MNETVQRITRYEVDGVTCYLATAAARLLGVHRKTVTRRMIRGEYDRVVDPDTGRVMVPAQQIDADLTGAESNE